MAKSTKASSSRRVFRTESLEPRTLRTLGVSAAMNLVQDLGFITRSAAVHGVEANASIVAGHSVTFQFSALAAGQYLLQVRHTGDGLTIDARGPEGSASIDPGPAGPSQTLILPILAAEYQVEVAAGDEPIFVDWELLLISGAGQVPALPTTLIATANAVPLPEGSISTGLVSPAPSTSTPISPPVCLTATIASVGPIGRPLVVQPIAPVGPTTPDGSMAMAFNGEGLPPGLAIPDEKVGLAGALIPIGASTMSPDASNIAALDEAILAAEPWWSRFTLALIPAVNGGEAIGYLVVEPAGPIELDAATSGDPSANLCPLESGLAMGLAASVEILRRRFRGAGRPRARKSWIWTTEGDGLVVMSG